MTAEMKENVCSHVWKMVEGRADLVVCDKCSAAKKIVIQQESQQPTKPLLVE